MSLHSIEVSVVYALPEQVWQKTLIMPRGSTAEDLFTATHLFKEFPELNDQFLKGDLTYGVYSQKIDENYLLEAGDRVEIYRSLTADPKDVRRELAKEGKTMSSGRAK